MLNLHTTCGVRHCDGLSRRDWLRIGALGLGGLTLPGLLHLERTHAEGARPRARSVIVLFLSGGPSHLDMWDPKPDAPEEIRGTFQPIATRVPGIRLSEHLPGTAAIMDRCCVIRSMQHGNNNHPAAAYWMMVGMPMTRPAPQIVTMSREDRPHPGAVAARLLPANPHVPPFVMVPEAISPVGPERPGQHAGFLGAAFDPYRVNSDANSEMYSPGSLQPGADMPGTRIDQRRALLAQVGAHARFLEDSEPAQVLDPYYTRAFDLVSSPAAQRAFDEFRQLFKPHRAFTRPGQHHRQGHVGIGRLQHRHHRHFARRAERRPDVFGKVLGAGRHGDDRHGRDR